MRMLSGDARRLEGHSEVRRCSQHGESEMEPSVMQSGVEIGEREGGGAPVECVHSRYPRLYLDFI